MLGFSLLSRECHVHAVGLGVTDLCSSFLSLLLIFCLNLRWAITLLWLVSTWREKNGCSTRRWLFPVNSGAVTYKLYPRVTTFEFIVASWPIVLCPCNSALSYSLKSESCILVLAFTCSLSPLHVCMVFPPLFSKH